MKKKKIQKSFYFASSILIRGFLIVSTFKLVFYEGNPIEMVTEEFIQWQDNSKQHLKKQIDVNVPQQIPLPEDLLESSDEWEETLDSLNADEYAADISDLYSINSELSKRVASLEDDIDVLEHVISPNNAEEIMKNVEIRFEINNRERFQDKMEGLFSDHQKEIEENLNVINNRLDRLEQRMDRMQDGNTSFNHMLIGGLVGIIIALCGLVAFFIWQNKKTD